MSSSSTTVAPPPRGDDAAFGEDEERSIFVGIPELKWNDNAISTSKYTLFSFLPKALGEQFRRKGNVVFLSMGLLMVIGKYTNFFDTAATPWTLLIPLFVVISISVLQEGVADYQRHESDKVTNNHICTVVRPIPNYTNRDYQEINPKIFDADNIFFEEAERQKIYPGDLVVIKNREMVPADIVILTSSNENGSAYIETSSIDGETNLKLRLSPSSSVFENLENQPMHLVNQALNYNMLLYTPSTNDNDDAITTAREELLQGNLTLPNSQMLQRLSDEGKTSFMTLTSEAPNDSVSTFTGKLNVPRRDEQGEILEDTTIALDADNLLLRGAVLRNTDWVIGVACFTGKDSKVAKNSFETPSKFSQLDVQMNKMIDIILYYLFFCAGILATLAVITHSLYFDQLYYAGYRTNTSTRWPYLPDSFPAPNWLDEYPSWIQFFLTFITLLPNLIPLALYVTVEAVTRFMMYLISVDKEMYHEETDTNAQARNMNVTDLGQVKYIFSDKTGTLTQNRMHFKRCSVDGTVFGAPTNICKSSSSNNNNDSESKKNSSPITDNAEYLPLARLVRNEELQPQMKQHQGKALSFNTEMFLRIMSICHTVVVEKDHEVEEEEIGSPVFNSFETLKRLKCSKCIKGHLDAQSPVDETENAAIDSSSSSASLMDTSSLLPVRKSVDGSPYGHAYQAESPDEGALVSAASLEFGFQCIGRDSNGIKIACSSPSIFEDEDTVNGLKSGVLTSKMLAQDIGFDGSFLQVQSMNTGFQTIGLQNPNETNIRIETWSLLAINKFDSARKRMSVLVRSPEEFGSIPILFCKGADSSMFVPSVCEGANSLAFSDPRASFGSLEVPVSIMASMELSSNNVNWELSSMMQIQSHLGEFASEGLRTLVLGMRILSEDECSEWLEIYRAAASSIQRRDENLSEAAAAIECKLHIVGATAIEDKLQDGVPETIHRIEQAGIKLWVLTGDKMETAIEIGYSTKVLNPKMYLTQIANKSIDEVKFLMAMEFVYLLQSGRLPEYEDVDNEQEIETGKLNSIKNCWETTTVKIERFFNSIRAAYWRFYYNYVRTACGLISIDETELNAQLDRLKGGEDKLERKQNRLIRHKNVREYAINILKEYRKTEDGKAALRKYRSMFNTTIDGAESEVESFSSSSIPIVYDQNQSANKILQNYGRSNRERVTVFEKLFAVDSDTRKGRLFKHMKKSSVDDPEEIHQTSNFTTRGLVVEGGALSHIMGEDMLEEIFFAISSTCDAVIACRVSPKQKALLVRLVRNYVEPSPVTLAIGDGANDVGMIQEAHIGVGISGLEGQQAVNSSDFSIAQFRFLDSLLLVHGKWNISRMSIVVLFSFFKNAIFSTLLMLYGYDNLYSGTPLVNAWVGSFFNFVAGFPILFLGCFDRDLEKDYIRKRPEVYAPGPNNEFITKRISLRWASMMLIFSFIIYFVSRPCLIAAGGMTSAFKGLMSYNNRDRPGDGEGSDLSVFGTTIFTVLIYTLGYKVLFEGRSLIHGVFPPCTCKKDSGEGVWSRLPYTWIGLIFGSFLFNFFALYLYAFVAQESPRNSPFKPFAHVTWHVFNKRSVTWMVMLIVPIIACAVDVAFKLFANMFVPSQLQVHREISVLEGMKEITVSKDVVVPVEGVNTELTDPLLKKSEII